MTSEQSLQRPMPKLLRPGRSHICAFFHNQDEEYEVLLPFIKQGLAKGEKAYHIVDSKLRKEHLRRLESTGIDVKAATARRQLEVKVWEEAYLRSERFDYSDPMLDIHDLCHVRAGLRLREDDCSPLAPTRIATAHKSDY